jgi:hypothetical protein
LASQRKRLELEAFLEGVGNIIPGSENLHWVTCLLSTPDQPSVHGNPMFPLLTNNVLLLWEFVCFYYPEIINFLCNVLCQR